jgi:predicted nucleotidyltransferase
LATLEELRQKRRDILTIAARHGASDVRVFGSVARGEAGSESDVDFLVEFKAGRGPWYGMGLNLDLEDLLGCRVDVATEEELHWLIRDQVLREAVPL